MCFCYREIIINVILYFFKQDTNIRNIENTYKTKEGTLLMEIKIVYS